MLSFIFNLTSEQAQIALRPQNTFTEIDTLAAMFGIERYPGERYKDFFDYYNRVSNQTREGSVPDIAQITSRSNLFTLQSQSKSTDYRFGIEITGNHDLNIKQHSWTGTSWTSTSTSWDLTNRKLYPFLHDILLDVRDVFPYLEVQVLGIEEEGSYSVCGMNLISDRNFRREGFGATATMMSVSTSFLPNTIKYDTNLYVLETSTILGTNGFYVDHHLGRLYSATANLDRLNVSYDVVEDPFVFRGSKGVRVRSLHSTEAFIKMIQNETFTPNRHLQYVSAGSTTTATQITGLHETPLFCRFFDEEINMRYRSR